MDFPLYFQNVIWPGGDTFFHQNFFLKKPNTSECAQVLVVTWVKLDCVEALLSPPPMCRQRSVSKNLDEDNQKISNNQCCL